MLLAAGHRGVSALFSHVRQSFEEEGQNDRQTHPGRRGTKVCRETCYTLQETSNMRVHWRGARITPPPHATLAFQIIFL